MSFRSHRLGHVEDQVVYLWLLLHLQLETRLRPSETLNFEALFHQMQSIAYTIESYIHYAITKCTRNEFKAMTAENFHFLIAPITS